jgi:hypothetical protein
MSIPRSVREILQGHVTLEVESIDRMYLNLYVPQLQRELGVVGFFRAHRGERIVSSVLMGRLTDAFVTAIRAFGQAHQIPMVPFARGQRKDDIAATFLAGYQAREGVLFVGRAQEKISVFRTEQRRDREGKTYPWLVRTSAVVNQYYFYCRDDEFGPFFLKFSSYFPYAAKLCLNGHEYLKRQLERESIPYRALDNGVLSCADPQRLQAIAAALSAERIEALARKWLARLPHPFTAADQAAGYRYELSVLQCEFSLTQVLDRPQTGRLFFEDVIRENLDLGRPEHVQLIFGRRVTRQTPGRFRTRVITEDVTPSLHLDYKHTRIKQYHKEGRALRTETTINDTRDFRIGKRLKNLPALKEIGFAANRRLLDVQRLTADCRDGAEVLATLGRPHEQAGRRVPALRFEDPRVQALCGALVLFRLLPHGFSQRELRAQLAPLLGLTSDRLSPGRMTYDLRRLRQHGMIERVPRTHRYRVTDFGLRAALFYTRAYARVVRRGLSEVVPHHPGTSTRLASAFRRLETAMDAFCATADVAA